VAATRGRVIAIDAGQAVVRCEQFDLTIPDAPATWRVGQFVAPEAL
jgi:hypothetical protein